MSPATLRPTVVTAILLAALPLAAQPPAAEPLPWQPDYATAVAEAQARHRHMVVMLTAADCEPCRRLESEVLSAPLVREGLTDMVWVRVENDDALESQLGVKAHPTLAFVNPFTAGVVHRVTGEKSVELLAREIVHARRAIGAKLTPALEAVASRMFSFDSARAEELLEAGDADGLRDLLAPSAADDSRQANYLVASVTLPAGMVPDDVRFLAGAECLVGTDTTADVSDAALVAARPPDLAESCAEYGIPQSGFVLVPRERADGVETVVRITAPGCRLVTDTIRFDGPAPANAVQFRRYDLEPLADAEAARLSGRVLTPAGTPATAATVRIDDWYDTPGGDATSAIPAVVRTDADGRFTFPRVSPGRWLVRAEFPGGEREQCVSLDPGGETTCTLALDAVTTVGLRWVLQTEELSQDLVGRGTHAGEAHTSVASSRIELARGMRVRTNGSGDLALAQTPLDDDGLTEEMKRAIADLPHGTPVWYPVDAAYTAEFLPISGMHRETRRFTDIDTVRAGDPLPEQEWAIVGPLLPQALAATRDRGTYFQFPLGEPVRVGDVFTLRCASSNCFAKLEVIDVTIVMPESRRPP